MAKTKTQLGTLTLQLLRVVEGDASPDSNDTTIIEAAYDEVYQYLRTKHLVTWGPSDSIPDEFVTPIANMTAYSRLSFFDVPSDVALIVSSSASRAVGDITERMALDYVSTPIPSEPL